MPVFDAHMALATLGIALVGGIIGLDRTAAGQFMISQPIVAGPLAGWMLGDLTAGLVIGTALELIWILDLPVGSFVPADATIATVSSTAISVLGAPAGAPLPVIGFSILLTIAMVPVTMRADNLVRTANSRLTDRVMTASGPDLARSLAGVQCAGLALFFLKAFVLCGLFIPLGVAMLEVFRHLPGYVHGAMALFVKLLPLLGAAVVMRKLSILTLDRYVLIGFATAAVGGQLLHLPVLAVLLLTAAAGWIGAEYRERRS